MNAVIYARFSSASQDEQTIEVQLKECRKYAKDKGYIPIKEYIDEAKTGRNDNRPAFKQMIKDSKTMDFNFVIVYKVDRVARNAGLGLNFEKDLKENGILVLSTVEPFIDDANGKLMRGMNYLIAQYYSDDYSQRIQKGLENVASNFQATGGQRILGFKTVDKKYVVDETEATAVKKVFEMYVKGFKVTEIVEYLNAKGFKTSRNGNFNKNSLHKILSNKRYIGTYIFNGIETPNKMPRIISDELFNEVQDMKKKREKAPATSKASEEYLLTSKLFCGYCKKPMVGSSANGNGGNYKYYICKDKDCHKKRISKQFIEDLVVSEAQGLLTDEYIKTIAKKMIKLCEEEKDILGINSLKKELTNIERKKNNLVLTIADEDDENIRNTFLKQLKEFSLNYETLLRELVIEESKQLSITEPRIVYFLNQLKNGNINDIKHRKTLINVFVNNIYCYDDNAMVSFNTQDKEVTIDLEMVKKMEKVLIKNDILHHIDRKLELFEYV